MTNSMAKSVSTLHRLTMALVVALTAWAAAAPAAADTLQVNVGGRQITLVIDPDQCELDRQNPSDSRLYDLVERALAGQNQLLMAAADCGQIPPWRAGTRPTLDDFTQVQVNLGLRERELTGQEAATSRAICTELRSRGDSLANSPELSRLRDRFNQSTEGVRLNETTFIGVVHEDSQACYASLVQKVRTEHGSDKLILGVYAHVVIKGRLLYIYRYTEGQKFDDMVRLLELLRVSVAAHLDANR